MNAALKLPPLTAELFPEFRCDPRPPSGELAALGTLSEVAPGVWVSGMPAFDLPSHVLCRLIPGEAPGTYTLEPEGSYPGYIRMSDDIGAQLGVIGLAGTTLRRLLALGYVDHIRPHPNGIFISIESLLEHFRRTANDCEREASYWTPDRCQAWREMLDSTNNAQN